MRCRIVMANKNLVIVESPAKAKTIEKILGKNYEVAASFGHICDLPKTKMGVDVNNDFKTSYSTIKGKGDVVKKLKMQAKNANKVYLASDPDREGEAIAWHIANALKLDKGEQNRIEFHEITDRAIREAVKNPRIIDTNKVNAQQARRVLDRLVGYEISPFLWKLISPNTSAGRVQSVALKLICDLEDKIRKFVPEKYWDVKGNFEQSWTWPLSKMDGKKVEKIKEESLVERVKLLQNQKFTVVEAKISKKSKRPPLALKTSTLQQLSSSYLGFSASRTMMLAQKLYEGININGNHKGLITYMRTDSTRISQEAKEMAKSYITETFGKEYVTDVKEKKESKQKIQDAHEAIRPTDVYVTPESLEKILEKDQWKLYKLIWERFLISELASMKYEQFEVVCEREGVQFRGSMNKILFDGYYKVFKEEEELNLEDFPKIEVGDQLELSKLEIKEDMTKPPARLTESSLVKMLETEGIGRPSTYATIIETLKKREYIVMEKRSFIPTEIGYEVKAQLEKYFSKIMNVKFTAELENELDGVELGTEDWISLLHRFYDGLKEEMEACKEAVQAETEKIILSDVLCSNGKDYMIVKTGRFGRYLASPVEGDSSKISLKNIPIPMEQLKQGKVFVKEALEESLKKKAGYKTDMKTETGVSYLLKEGRFGSYLESENFKEDGLREALPAEIRKELKAGSIEKIDGIYQIQEKIRQIKEEEEKLVREAGVCEKCGKPFKVNRGRWGKFLSCTGYPECRNIRKIEKK